ncbi:O-antigen ligase family protein [Klebsiella michiganensis]|uniref:O-antigen ligase family protein n=3 Tax=Klebsiella michiganensis TaxID=1134687 RepID=UPI0015F768AF|nr:O-antigen ligase family protein [Klebsiella michiganensis]ELR9564916.1 O-antigen ligase family protein [Klebsiella michiganensis]MCZ0077313.1 O-antigen ligase family protein [Klebsiella michiganensis]MCZ9439759.1 O-antigen ligase family protein [Klebsiella michiganensis]WAT41618.1 O-antigen ligase family protein [Klebsiella michiganensis]HDX8867702.1 O-antigen ligase family protein [Klebsiella michiganensis]
MRLKFKVDDIAIRLYLFAILIITLVPFGRGSVSGLEPAVPFIILSFILFSLTKKYIDKKKWFVIFMFFLWAVWIISGIAFSYITYDKLADHESSFLRYVRLLEMYFPALLVFAFINELSPKQKKTVYRFFIFLFFVVTIEAAWGWFMQMDILVAKQRFSYPGMGYIYRAGGVANDSSAYGSLALILGVASLIGLRHTSKSKILYLLIIVGLVFNIYISLTRTIIFALAMYVFFDLIRTRSLSIFKMLFFAAICAGVVFYGISNDYIIALLDRVTGSGQIDITSGRLATWAAVPDILGENPIFGVGYRMATDKYGIVPDNVFISSILETGVIGVTLYMGMLISLCYCVYKNNSESLPLLLAFIASGMFVDISTFWISIPALIFFVAVNSQRDDDGSRHRVRE